MSMPFSTGIFCVQVADGDCGRQQSYRYFYFN